MMNHEKILVTGGNGYIGKYVEISLIQMGYVVHATYKE